MTVNILGADYTVTITGEIAEPRLIDCDGFCDETTKEICADDYKSRKEDKNSKGQLEVQLKKVVRHEIIHAFLFESGLAENSNWAKNEEMVDWIAIQIPKMIKAMQEVKAL